ncbi:MAG TPA: hypothetical protein VKB79_07750 [Bryobacteraceae bacterium]|nr:hypothetical protein [Bryobacteraceae bacterium]
MVFFAQVLDHLQLALIHPSGYRDQHKPEWIKAWHLAIINASGLSGKLLWMYQLDYSHHTA